MLNKYESHLTIKAVDEASTTKLQQFCQTRGLKCLIIHLARGQHSVQPMISALHQGSEANAKVSAFQLAQDLNQAGLEVTRVKIEAYINNNGVPEVDGLEELSDIPKQYFELHVKITLNSEQELQRLQQFCQKYAVHLSKNSQDESQDRFITLRISRVGRTTAQTMMDILVLQLKTDNFQITKQIREFVIYDSNLELDRGW